MARMVAPLFRSSPNALSSVSQRINATSKPLQWVGYDSSAYAVGKAMVVAEMLRAGAPTDAVLQVRALRSEG